MTHTLKAAFKEAEKLPAPEQNKLAELVLNQIKEMQDTFARAFTRLSENSFADWDNEKDATYDHWEEHYGVQ